MTSAALMALAFVALLGGTVAFTMTVEDVNRGVPEPHPTAWVAVFLLLSSLLISFAAGLNWGS